MTWKRKLITVVETRSYRKRATKLMSEQEQFDAITMIATDPESCTTNPEKAGITGAWRRVTAPSVALA